MAEGGYLFDVLALLLAAVAVVPLLQRLGVPSVLGYLAAGVTLGPYTPGLVVDIEPTRPLAEFGVVFLLFAIGLELRVARLKSMRRYILGLGLLQVTCTGALFCGLAVLAGLPSSAALVVGVTLAFSSTATVLGILIERNEAVAQHGRISVAILIFQDLAVVPVLALLPLLAGEVHHIGTALGLAALKAVVAVAIIFVVGRLLLRPAYHYIAAAKSPEMFTAANLLVVLAVAWLTAEAGMSMALGALLAGLLLADSPYRHQVEADIEPFRGLLLGLFFMTVGMSIDLPFVADAALEVLAVTVVCLAVKTAVVALLGRAFGLGWGQSLRVGLLLGQIGEFGFVVFAKAGALGLLDLHHTQTLLAATALTMVLTPVLAAQGRRLAQRARQRQGVTQMPKDTEQLQRHVLIAGFGRVGRTIARLLEQHGISYVALDLDTDGVARARERDLPVYYGDASHAGVLRSIGIRNARAAVITVNRPKSAESTVAAIRNLAPDLPIIARAHDLEQEEVLMGIGASAVVPETMEASFQMAGLILRSAGIPGDEIEHSLAERRAGHYGALAKS